MCRSSAWQGRTGISINFARGPGTHRQARRVDPAAFDKLSGILRYVAGDYKAPATFEQSAKSSAPPDGQRTTLPSLPHFPARRGRTGEVGLHQRRPRYSRKAIWPRPRLGTGSDPNGGSRAPKSLMTNHLPLSLIELLRRCSRCRCSGSRIGLERRPPVLDSVSVQDTLKPHGGLRCHTLPRPDYGTRSFASINPSKPISISVWTRFFPPMNWHRFSRRKGPPGRTSSTLPC